MFLVLLAGLREGFVGEFWRTTAEVPKAGNPDRLRLRLDDLAETAVVAPVLPIVTIVLLLTPTVTLTSRLALFGLEFMLRARI